MDLELIEGDVKDYPYEFKCEQLSDEWFKERLRRLTGSKWQKIKPSSRQKINEFSEAQLKILRDVACGILTGEREQVKTTAVMQRGTDLEPEAKRQYSLKNMVNVRDCGIYLISDYLASSPDGIVGEDEKILEIKCPESKQHLRYMIDSKELYKDYEWQLYGEMWGTGIDKGDICSYDPRFPFEKRLVVHSFEVDKDQMELVKNRMFEAVELIKSWIT